MPEPRNVLVTGAASGIGLAIARAFAAQGDRLHLADVQQGVRDVARGLSSSATAYVADLGDTSQVVDLARQVNQAGGCDVLVNCAGISIKRNGESILPANVSLEDWERVMRINLTAPFLLCRDLVAHMQRRKFGRIVNIASRAGRTFVGSAGIDYAASKAALLGMTRHFAGSYAADGITANCIAPGRIETPLSSTSSARVLEEAVRLIPAKRLGTTDEIAATACFLASAGAAYITGACVDVNGGVFMS